MTMPSAFVLAFLASIVLLLASVVSTLINAKEKPTRNQSSLTPLSLYHYDNKYSVFVPR